ncbi:YeeE/YedE family protein [bacterium]|nr:YeeE/YedE family protein [bacterium]
MRFPIEAFGGFSAGTGMLVALLIGVGFGFFLERAGFGSARKLTAQFYLKDFAVLKVMFTAIVVASVGFWWLVALGMLDLSVTFINPTYLVSQIAGGLILGIGFAIGGYCPGTSCVAVATGKLDALWYVGGVVFGIFVYSLTEPLFDGFTKLGSMGEAYVWDWLGVAPGVVVLAAVLMAVGAFSLGTWVERRSGNVLKN